MGEFTIDGTRNLDFMLQADIEGYKPTFRLSGGTASGIKSDYGDFLFQVSRTKNYSVWLSEYRMLQSAVLCGAANDPLLELHCMLTGGMKYETDGLGTVSIPQNTFNLHQQPYIKNKVYLPKNSQAITFNIHLQPEYLYNLCPYYPQLDRFIEQIINKKSALMQEMARPLTIELTSVITSILNAPVRTMEQSHILSAAIETIISQGLYYLTDATPPPIKVTTQQRGIVEEIKLYLQRDLDEHTLIPDLAHHFGMNDCQLKAIFKAVTGLTIFQFLTRERMAKAAWLLRNSSLSIEEIGYMVGYKDASAFGYRFKRLFLLSPLQYRASR